MTTTKLSVGIPHPVDRHVGRRVAALRLQRGFSQSDLARAIGLTFQQVQKYEKGTNRISASKLWDISRFLAVDIRHFFEDFAQDAGGVAEDQAAAFEHTAKTTRSAIKLARLVPQLSVRKQKLALDFVRVLAGEDAD